MMTATELLSQLRARDIRIWVEDDRLRLNAPKGALTPELQEQLVAHKAEILAYLQTVQTASSLPVLTRVNGQGLLPLSFAQKRLWFLDQMEPGNPAYNIATAMRLFGALDIAAVQASLNTIIERHESLRTTYTAVAGEPYQVIHDVAVLPLQIGDLCHLAEPEREAEAQRLVHEEAERPFDLSVDLPVRVTLLHLTPEEHIFMVTMHHIASDGWSFTIFSREFARLYEANRCRETVQLDPLPIQYADYAAWQQSWIENDRLTTQLAYWKRHLSGELTTLDLPADYNRPVVRSFHGETQVAWLPADLRERLVSLFRHEDVTLFMILLAAFKLLMHRYSGQEDIIIGSPIAGRTQPEVENLIGLFLNTIVLRTDFSGDPSFRETLRRVRQMSLEAFSNQDIPFEKLLEELKVERDLSRTPIFQVFFNMLNFTGAPIQMEGIRGESIINPDLSSKFDLTLYLSEVERRIKLTLVYNADLFTAARMEVLLAQYESLLHQICANPDLPLSDYTLVYSGAQSIVPDPTQPLNGEWMGAVHEALSQHAALRGGETAVTDPTDTWTYNELNQRSNQLAHYLIARGVQPQDVVAIYSHRSASLVWALMGAFKAGAAFLILDPTYPEARLASYLELGQPKAFLRVEAAGEPPPQIDEALAAINCQISLTLPSLAAARNTALFANWPTTDPEVTVGPDDRACLAFTSGSTGTPKGIQGRHGSLTHFLPWISRKFGLDHTDRFSMLSGLAHDPLQRDIFTALWVGGTLCIPDPEQIMTPGWTAQWLREQRVTFANLTPAMSQVITAGSSARDGAVASIPTLRYAFFIGEMLTRQDVNNLRRLCPGVTAVNLYGATETQRALSYYVAPPDSHRHGPILKDVLPLGKAMPGAQLLLLNKAGKLAGVGELAEISFRSPHLALGYLHDAAQTKRSFRPNPFGPTDERDRIYLTGDLGRYLPDGSVEFVHRADQQVKVRGFRVELGEIDALLGQHTAVHQAVTIASKNAHVASMRLSSFVVLKPGHTATDTELRAFLREKFPSYMVPADILLLNALPLTPNGKVDRKALPVPDHTHSEPDSDFAEARSEIEAILVRIWEEVLDVHPISIHDNFFEIGGHSLVAVRAFAQIERETGLQLPLTVLFQAPTIAQLAHVIETKGWHSNWTSLVAIQTQGNRPPFFYVSPFLISVLSLSLLGTSLGSDQPLYGLQPQGIESDHPIHRSVEEMARHYIDEIRTLKPTGPYMLGGHCAGSWVAFEMAQQLQAQGEKVDLLVLVDSRPPNFEPPPVSRWRYIANRIAWYWKGGRLRDAIVWQLRLVRQRYITLNFGEENFQRTAIVRQAHAEAHQAYRTNIFDGDVLFLRSYESAALKDKDWHYRWSELITGELKPVIIPGTHADLLVEPNVHEMATHIRAAIDEVLSRSEPSGAPESSAADHQ